jgi:hypothetical protein
MLRFAKQSGGGIKQNLTASWQIACAENAFSASSKN